MGAFGDSKQKILNNLFFKLGNFVAHFFVRMIHRLVRFPEVSRHSAFSVKDSVPSYALMLRAGLIRHAGSHGLFSILPDGVKVLQKIEQIVDHRLQEIGKSKEFVLN
jgi:hypothetical protein